MNRLSFGTLAIVSVTFLAGCTTGKYLAPDVISASGSSFTRTIDEPFDTTWSNLIQYASTSPFHIDHFEKASGLLTMSLSPANPREYVTGGHWEMKGIRDFSGDYVDYLTQEAEGTLQATMNVVVSPLESNKSRVFVNVSYYLSATIPDRGSYTWSFASGSSDTKRVLNYTSANGDTITIVSTNKAELGILDGVTHTH